MKRAALLFAIAVAAQAHVGSPDVFLEGSAGPYPLFVTIRPPSVIPGVAQIEIRCSSPGIRELRVAPTPLTGRAADFPPTPDTLQRSKDDAQFFTGALWIMAPGSWQVRIQADGDKGPGRLSVPVPAVATTTKPMQFALGGFLFVMMLVLAWGFVSIVGAAARESQLPPAALPDAAAKRRARIRMAITAAIVLAVLWGGDRWWTSEASGYAGNIYKPIQMIVDVQPHDKLVLTLKNPEWSLPRQLDDFVPDHGHLMHLYVIRWPQIDRVWHLHPDMTQPGVFTHYLPPMPAGTYKLYADVVHKNGFPETITGDLTLMKALAGTPITGDDAAGEETDTAPPIIWKHGAIKAGKPDLLRFELLDKSGEPARDMQLYMGMLGHLAIIKDDGTVFAHIHPSGSVAMPALMMANPSEDHSMHNMGEIPPESDFPYGFPKPGRYHVVVQMKHAGVVETGIFGVVVQ
jgi:hypothetical protein